MPSKRDLKTFGLGFGAAFLIGSMWPAIKDGCRPATKSMIKGLLFTSGKIKTLSAELQSEVEDMVAEVQFENVQDNVSEVKEDILEEGMSNSDDSKD